MLEGVPDLTLRALNEATLAFVEMEYNRKTHSELGRSPSESFRHDKDVGRPCPDSQALRLAFTAEWGRTLRRSDLTTNLKSVRLEVPSRYGHFPRLSAARRLLGSEPRLSGRPEHRRHSLPALSSG